MFGEEEGREELDHAGFLGGDKVGFCQGDGGEGVACCVDEMVKSLALA